MIYKDKNLFKSHINSSDNIVTFNRFSTLYNDGISNNVTEQSNQSNIIETIPNNTITANL